MGAAGGKGSRDMWISPSLEVCVRSGEEEGCSLKSSAYFRIWGTPIQSLLSPFLWLTSAVSNIWQRQTLLGDTGIFFFMRISFIHVHKFKLTSYTVMHLFFGGASLGTVPLTVG